MSKQSDLVNITQGDADINGGTIDGTVIGGSTPAAISGTTITATGDVDIADKIIHSGDSNTTIRFPAADTVTVETAGSERVRVDSDGNVGIGTSSPSYTAAGRGNLNIAGSGGAILGFQIGGSAKGYVFHDNTNLQMWNEVAGNLLFATSGSERMRIDSAGRVQINTTASKYSALLTLVKGNNSYNITSSVTGTNAQGHIVFENNNADAVGSIFTVGSATSYNTSSDYRLKEDVQPMVGATDRLMALKPVNFAWKADGSRVDGFIAHEAQAVVPEAVTGEKDAVDADGNPEYQGIDQSKIVPLLTAALQEALTKINDQQSALELLEARVAQLEGGAA